MDIVRLQKNVAFLIDGAFFIQRFKLIFGPDKSPKEIADKLEEMVRFHLSGDNLYRIFYYDCYPYDKKETHPLTNKILDFASTKKTQEHLALFEELKSRRKVALRLSEAPSTGNWLINPQQTQALLQGTITAKSLKPDEVHFSLAQKGV